MGLISTLVGSFKKSKKLQKLQRQISPPGQSVLGLVSDFRQSLSNEVDPKDQALEEFLDLCESDEGVLKVVNEFKLTRIDLKRIYIRLNAAGLGQYIKGHHVALSSIAYYEPLRYIVESERHGENWGNIARNILFYWEGKIPQFGLIKKLR